LVRISSDYQRAHAGGPKTVLWDFVFYVRLGTVFTLAVQIAGVVVVFAYLIIPATISAIFSSRLTIQLIIVWTASITASIMGLLFAYYLDFSIGPAIALFLGCELIIAALHHRQYGLR